MIRFTPSGVRIGVDRKVPNPPIPLNLGSPITEETAIAIRRTVFGQCPAEVIRPDLFSQGPGMVFHDAERDLGYALNVGNTATTPMSRSVLMGIQAHILRALLFEATLSKLFKVSNPLLPTISMQKEALCSALADIIWKSGDGQSCVLCLMQTSKNHISNSGRFNEDGVTEKLQLVELNEITDLRQLIRRYLHLFQEDPGPGLLLLLYSVVLSRGIDRINEDLGQHKEIIRGIQFQKCLVDGGGAISFNLLNLLLIGYATPFLHNGVEYHKDQDGEEIARTGVLFRSPIGLLIWMENEQVTASYRLGSCFKTPVTPVWLVVANEHTGVLFSENSRLLNDYRSENRFQLRYYSSSHRQTKSMILRINSRIIDDQEADAPIHTLDRIIQSKWTDAQVNWNGVEPFL